MESDLLREKLLACLGGDWPTPPPLASELLSSTQKEGYRLESISYQVEPGCRVPALLLIPDQASSASLAPALAVWHQHNGQWHWGKSEPAGLVGDRCQHVGVALAQAGYVVLCPDALCFEERQSPHLTGDDYERFEFLNYVVAGKSLAWKNILDMRRAIDYLCSRPEVCDNRIGCFGHSMGSTHCWMVGPWERRLRCIVANCCLPTYRGIRHHHLLHCFPNFVPGFSQFGDTPDIAALVAPTPMLMNFGAKDKGSPIEEVHTGVKCIEAAYTHLDVHENFQYFIEPNTGHTFTDAMQQRTWNWFDQHLA